MRFRSAVAIGPWTLAGLIALSPLGAGREAAAQGTSHTATILDNSRAGQAARAACPTSCDDGNTCTVDSCDRHGRCRNVDLARCNNPYAATLPLPAGSLCTAITSCSIPDADGDGLNDAWEIQGGIDLDCDGEIDPARDLRLPGADPLRKDVYLEYDYMVLPDQGTACAETAERGAGQSCLDGICRGHSHAPSRKAIRANGDELHLVNSGEDCLYTTAEGQLVVRGTGQMTIARRHGALRRRQRRGHVDRRRAGHRAQPGRRRRHFRSCLSGPHRLSRSLSVR